MNALTRFWTWLKGAAPVKYLAGSKIFALLTTHGGIPGSWTQDRNEQARHLRGWVYVAIRSLAKMVAGAAPSVGIRRNGDDLLVRQEKGAKFLSRRARRKMLAQVQDHEDIEPAPQNHPLVKLLQNPNPPDTAWTFFYRSELFLRATGNLYWWAVPNKLGLPCELWVIPSHWIWPCKGSLADPEEYEVRPRAAYWGGQAVRIPGDEIIHIRYPGLIDPFDGYSPLAAGATWIDNSESIDRSQWAKFKNGVNSDIMIELDKSLEGVDEAGMERLAARIHEKYVGENATGKPLVMSPGAKAVPLKTTPVEMDYIASGDQKRDWVLALFGVSKSLIGITEDANRASAEAAIANFVFREVGPDLMLLGQMVTEKLASRFDEKLVVYWPDLTPDDPEMALKKMTLGVQSLAVSRNELREFLDLEPQEGADSPYGPIGAVEHPYKRVAPVGLPMPGRRPGQPVSTDGVQPVVAETNGEAQANGQANRDPFGVSGSDVQAIKVARPWVSKFFSRNGHK